MERYFIIAGSSVLLILGVLHFVYTFFTNKLAPRNHQTLTMMENENPVLTKRTTIWKSWVGFNASHSIGIIFFAIINILLASQHLEIHQKTLSIILLDDVCLALYLFLGKRYWFKKPFLGILTAFLCFIVASALIVIHK